MLKIDFSHKIISLKKKSLKKFTDFSDYLTKENTLFSFNGL